MLGNNKVKIWGQVVYGVASDLGREPRQGLRGGRHQSMSLRKWGMGEVIGKGLVEGLGVSVYCLRLGRRFRIVSLLFIMMYHD